MPEFSYTAKSSTGEQAQGTIAASSRRDALQQLRQRALFPLEVTDAVAAKPASLNVRLPWGGRVKKDVIADTCTQLADLLGNGVPLLEALDTLADATVNPRLQ